MITGRHKDEGEESKTDGGTTSQGATRNWKMQKKKKKKIGFPGRDAPGIDLSKLDQ